MCPQDFILRTRRSGEGKVSLFIGKVLWGLKGQCLVSGYRFQARDGSAVSSNRNVRDISTLGVVKTREVDAVA